MVVKKTDKTKASAQALKPASGKSARGSAQPAAGTAAPSSSRGSASAKGSKSPVKIPGQSVIKHGDNGHETPGQPVLPNTKIEFGMILLPDEELRKVKSGLTKRDLDHYRKLLLEKRSELLGDVASLQTDSKNNRGDNLSTMPTHMADVGSDNYEQEFTLGLVEADRRLLREIDDALARIENNTYGVCMVRGIPIGKPRLDVKPWATFCIEIARERDKRGRR